MPVSKDKIKAYNKQYYQKNRERLIADKRRVRADRKQRIAEIKSVPCADCGLQFPPVCMDFDHINGSKTEGVAQMVLKTRPWEDVLEEIAKCEIVCANCHRIRHHGTMNS